MNVPALRDIEQWYLARPSREQSILLAAAVIVPVLLLYLAVWNPVMQSRARLEKELPALRETAQQFRAQAEEVEQLRARAPVRSASRSARAAIEDTAGRQGITLQSVESVGNERSAVQLGPVAFDALSRWLGDLASSEGLSVESLQLGAAAEGQVKVDRMVLAPASRRAPAGGRN